MCWSINDPRVAAQALRLMPEDGTTLLIHLRPQDSHSDYVAHQELIRNGIPLEKTLDRIAETHQNLVTLAERTPRRHHVDVISPLSQWTEEGRYSDAVDMFFDYYVSIAIELFDLVHEQYDGPIHPRGGPLKDFLSQARPTV